MRTATILTLMFLAMGAASQDAMPLPAFAQCKFSDGTSIDVSYLLNHQRYRLSTSGPLLTTHGTSVPAGDYTVYLEKDSHQHWTLKMTKPIGRKGLFVLLSPMSVTSFALPVESPEISFDHTGGSCMMIWNHKESDTVLSLEFTQKNADMPVLR